MELNKSKLSLDSMITCPKLTNICHGSAHVDLNFHIKVKSAPVGNKITLTMDINQAIKKVKRRKLFLNFLFRNGSSLKFCSVIF